MESIDLSERGWVNKHKEFSPYPTTAAIRYALNPKTTKSYRSAPYLEPADNVKEFENLFRSEN
jgi:hypothetical protein